MLFSFQGLHVFVMLEIYLIYITNYITEKTEIININNLTVINTKISIKNNSEIISSLYNLFWKCMRPESSSYRAQNSKEKLPLAVVANTAYLRR